MRPTLFIAGLAIALSGPCATAARGAESYASPVALGRTLFHDPNLSLQRTQSCATCHAPQRAFTDARRTGVQGAVSLGADGLSLGRRNAPTLTYAAFTPTFARDAEGFLGGQFYDGRAATLKAQVSGPLHDPTEMALPDAAALAGRLRERPEYLTALQRFSPSLELADDLGLYDAALQALVAFERSEAFSSFDSRYDRYLAGDYEMTLDERMGRELFFSDLVNCRSCHLQDPQRRQRREPFSSYRYFNIGVPVNAALTQTAVSARLPDRGLEENSQVEAQAVDGRSQRGRFRVPTLRNVAITAPYMHNGVFQQLSTAVRFYGRYIVANEYSETNPESNRAWGEPEVAENIEWQKLAGGQPIGPIRVRQLTAFLRTLTDQRYEHLLLDQ